MKLNHYKLLFITLIFLCFSTSVNGKVIEQIESPNKELQFNLISDNGDLKYQLLRNKKQIVSPSLLGLTLGSNKQLTDANVLLKATRSKVDYKWNTVYGEQNSYINKYNELTINFGTKSSDKIHNWSLIVRAYNEGIAFMYEFSGDKANFKAENTEFRINSASMAWTSNKAQSWIYGKKATQLVGSNIMERPLLVELPNKSCYLALGEAKLVDFPRMKFKAEKVDGSDLVLSAKLSGEASLSSSKDNMNTPWRYVMCAATPAELLQNNGFILNLNDKCELDDTSWIKPGKVLREVTLTTQGAKACVDFAKRNDIEYIMFDAGWYGPEYSPASDATTVTIDPKRSKGPFDMDTVLEYSKNKGIGIILYVNRRALEKQDAQAFKLYESWGNIVGVKYGFVTVGSQQATNWLHESIKLAAKHKLMVNVHDEYRPTGWSRTYPHLLTQEGVRGDEESASNEDVIKTIFTRMIAGAADQTNCYYAPRVEEKMGSRVSQMAKMICVYSPFQSVFWYDRPEGSPHNIGGAGGAETFIIENDETKFYSTVPTVWDETKVIEGYPGEYVRIARRSGKRWFMGGLTGKKGYNFKVDFQFLNKGKYSAKLYTDKVVDGKKMVDIKEINIDKNSKLNLNLEPKQGFAIVINYREPLKTGF